MLVLRNPVSREEDNKSSACVQQKPGFLTFSIPILLLGMGLSTPLTPASAQSLNKPIIFGEELPPSSPSSTPALSSPPASSLPQNSPYSLPDSPLRPSAPNYPASEREYNYQAPNSPSQANTATPRRASRDRLYLVVIPGAQIDLPNIAAQVVQLGAAPNGVRQRTAPRGPHVAIGPFDNRGLAEQWSNYLKSHGMSARVFFGR
ncbi:MAG: hypothetical protein F6K14_07555 [Symploca sp. SIO2C1]|nr:hypothetical protein [Symploca sp. SIO2C1]